MGQGYGVCSERGVGERALRDVYACVCVTEREQKTHSEGMRVCVCVCLHACKILPRSLLTDDIILSGRCHGNEQAPLAGFGIGG